MASLTAISCEYYNAERFREDPMWLPGVVLQFIYSTSAYAVVLPKSRQEPILVGLSDVRITDEARVTLLGDTCRGPEL